MRFPQLCGNAILKGLSTHLRTNTFPTLYENWIVANYFSFLQSHSFSCQLIRYNSVQCNSPVIVCMTIQFIGSTNRCTSCRTTTAESTPLWNSFNRSWTLWAWRENLLQSCCVGLISRCLRCHYWHKLEKFKFCWWLSPLPLQAGGWWAHWVLDRTPRLWDRMFKSGLRHCHTSFDESDSTVSRADSVQVSLRSNTQGCSHRLAGGLQNLDCPLSLFHMLKILRHRRNKNVTEM